jgi:CubicO group peptidase (beta-lactamase class C family)
MKTTLTLLFSLTFALLASANSQTIEFSLDLRASKLNETSVIAIRGSLKPLDWDKNIVLKDDDKDGIFKATITFESTKATMLEYKYICGEQWESIANRSINISSTTSVTDVWNKDLSSPPYIFKKEKNTLNFAERMASEQIVHGVSQLIIRNNQIDTILTWGFRDVEAGLPVDANTVFHIGGMGQSLTAFAVLRAAETKLLDLDKPVNQYLTSMKIDGDATVRDLLLGKIQVNGMVKPDGYKKGQKIPTLSQMFAGEGGSNIPRFKQKKGESKDAIFTIFGALLEQQLLEDIYKKTFSEIIQTEILLPLGMKNTFVKAELNDTEAQNASVGYNKKGKAVSGKRLIFPELGFGGVWTSPSDYSKFILHVMKASRGEDNRLLSQPLAQSAIKSSSSFRALVFPCGSDGNYLGGAATGFRTQTSFNTDENWVMISFMNSYENWRVMIDLEGAGRKLMQTKR